MGSRADLIEQLRAVAAYDPDTGLLTWRTLLGYRGQPLAKSGKPMGCVDPLGYIKITFGGHQIRAHQAAWALHYGRWPDGEIDHLNGNRADNRIANLRDVPRFVNCQNQRTARSTSRTGLLGAHWSAAAQKYTAQITRHGVKRHLGLFQTAEQAHAAYVAAKRSLHEGNTL